MAKSIRKREALLSVCKVVLGLLLVALPVTLVILTRNDIRRFFKRGDAPAGKVEKRRLMSRALGRDAVYWVYLPPGFEDSGRTTYPVLYMLHGMFRDHTAYINRVDADIVYEKLLEQGMVKHALLVLPEGDAGFYTNWVSDPSQRWEDFIISDLIEDVEGAYPVIKERSGRGITGFSMGGLAAMKLALKHPELFGSASSQYGGLSLRLRGKFDNNRQSEYLEQMPSSSLPFMGKRLRSVFGEDINKLKTENPADLVVSMGLKNGDLRIRVDCGEDDAFALDEQARDFHHVLEQKDIEHEFQIFPGNHNDDYLREHIHEILLFHLAN